MTKVYVEVPDPLEGWLLAQRVLPLQATVRPGEGNGWQLEIDAPLDRLEHVLGAVRKWLRDEQLPATQVHADGRVIVVKSDGSVNG